MMDVSPPGKLVQSLYEATLDADKWPQVMCELGALLEDSPVLFGLAYPSAQGMRPIIQSSYLLDDAVVESFASNAHSFDELKLAKTFLMAPVAKTHTLEEYFDEAEILDSFEFKNYFQPYDLAHYGLGMVLSRAIDHLGTLTVFRRITDKRHSAQSRALLDALGPHLHLAVRISHELGHLREALLTKQE